MRPDAQVVYEGFWRRMLAGLTDLTLAAVVVVTLVLLAIAVGGSAPDAPAIVADLAELPSHAAWLVAFILSAQTLFWAFLAATPGMLLLGCQVLDAKSGRRLSLAKSFARALGLWLGLACLGVGVWWILRDPRRQGLHDKLVGSVVIKEDESLLALDELLGGMR